jgi:hypothetical protein
MNGDEDEEVIGILLSKKIHRKKLSKKEIWGCGIQKLEARSKQKNRSG